MIGWHPFVADHLHRLSTADVTGMDVVDVTVGSARVEGLCAFDRFELCTTTCTVG